MSDTLTAPASDRIVTAKDNAPPAPPEAPDPFGAISAHIEDLFTEARNWADGTALTSQAQADEISRLIDDIRKAERAADAARVEANKPFDDGKAAVQAQYAPLIANTKTTRGKTVLALEACRAALAPWLAAIEAENARKATEARQAAQKAADEAAEAVRAAQATSDLAARERAEEQVAQARQAESAATRAEGAKAHATGGERAVGLRDNYVVKGLEDQTNEDGTVTAGKTLLLRHYAQRRPDALLDWLLGMARADVRSGVRQIPGVLIANERTL